LTTRMVMKSSAMATIIVEDLDSKHLGISRVKWIYFQAFHY